MENQSYLATMKPTKKTMNRKSQVNRSNTVIVDALQNIFESMQQWHTLYPKIRRHFY